MTTPKRTRKPCSSCQAHRDKVKEAIRKRDLKLATAALIKGAAELLTSKKKL